MERRRLRVSHRRSIITWTLCSIAACINLSIVSYLVFLLSNLSSPRVEPVPSVYVLSVEWTPSACRINWNLYNCTGLIEHDWVIRSFRPQPEDELKNCDDSLKFTEEAINDLEPLLSRHWPKFYHDGSNVTNWDYEWSHHGSCSPNQFSVYQYFDEALKLNSHFNVGNWLSNGGIKPKELTMDEVKYSEESVIAALTKYIPESTFVLQCEEILEMLPDKMLIEIQLCITFKGNKPQPARCPSFVQTSCQGDFHFPDKFAKPTLP